MFLLATSLAASLSSCDGDDIPEKLDGGHADSGARGTDASAPDADRDASAGRDAATAGACDLLAQDCSDGTEKCAIVQDAAGTLMSACVPVTGAAAAGDTCTRTAAGFGHDDCAPKLFCSFIGEAGPDQGGTRRCHALCDDDAQCANGERCGVLVTAQTTGFCGPSCEPFSDCGKDLTCGDFYNGVGGTTDVWLACRPTGDAKSGAPCANAYECPADHVCTDPAFGNDLRCIALCDVDHACKEGTCQKLGTLRLCI